MVRMESGEVANMVDGDEAGASISICLKAATVAKYRGADGLRLSVPAGAGRKALQKLIHHLLQLSKTDENEDSSDEEDVAQSKPEFHFLADNEPLRTTLGSFLSRRGRSREETLIVTYYIPLPTPQLTNESKPSPNWLSSVSVREISNLIKDTGVKNRPAIALPLVVVGSYSGAPVVYCGGTELVAEDTCSKEDGQHKGPIKAVAWTSDEEFVTASLDQTVRLWRVQPGVEDGPSKGSATTVAEFRSEEAGEPISFHSIATTGDTRSGEVTEDVRIAAGGEDGSVWTLTHTVDTTGGVSAVQNGGVSEKVKLGKRRRSALGTLAATRVGAGTMRAAVTDLQWTSEGHVISSSLDGFLRLWDIEACTLSTTIPCGNKSLFGLSIARGIDDGIAPKRKLTVVVGAADGGVRVVDAGGGGIIAACGRKGAHNGVVTDVAWIHTDKHLASSGVDGSIRLWDVRAMAMPVRVARDCHGGQSCMAVAVAQTSQGHSIYSVGTDGRLVTLELNQENRI